jgi:transcriptional regulator with XRE-family HTH domain
MGRSSRPRPARLGEKLTRIRRQLGLSQEMMLDRLEDASGLTQTSISGYELGVREPPLTVLLSYSRLANVHLEVLADDNLDLPEDIPSRNIHAGIVRLSKGKKQKR